MKLAYAILIITAICVTSPVAASTELLYGESRLTLLVEDVLGETITSWDYQFPGLSAKYNPDDYPWIEPPLTFKLKNIHCETLPDPTIQAALFCNVPLEANVGETLWVSGQTNPSDFAEFVSILTDPVPDKTSIWANIGFADCANDYFVSTGHGWYLTEGLSDEIIRIGLRIDYASTSPAVPEPSTAAAFVFGLLPFGILLRKRAI